MTFSFTSLVIGSLIGGLAAAGVLLPLGLFAYRRLQKRLLRALRVALARQIGRQGQVAGKLTGIVVQLQENQAKQHEQLHKLAEFSLRLKKEMAIVSARQDDPDEGDGDEWVVGADEPPRYLN